MHHLYSTIFRDDEEIDSLHQEITELTAYIKMLERETAGEKAKVIIFPHQGMLLTPLL